MSAHPLIHSIEQSKVREDVPNFRPGDTVKVHARIVEGNKERVQVFEGVVLKRSKSLAHGSASFTVRKISYNVGVERTFPVHSPRIEKIELVRSGKVRQARLFYIRPLRGKSARIKSKFFGGAQTAVDASAATTTGEA